MHNHHLARAIANASWNMFATMLEYKCKWYGKKLVRVNPACTSQTCSECGCLNSRLGYDRYGWLSIRNWNCPNCGAHLDRDVNAAMNILNLA
jgi:putative transposase